MALSNREIARGCAVKLNSHTRGEAGEAPVLDVALVEYTLAWVISGQKARGGNDAELRP